jgi:hypothetical protein
MSESSPNRTRVESDAPRTRTGPAPLLPKHPPSRRNRKGRAFEGESARLRAHGYTLEAIREAKAPAPASAARPSMTPQARGRDVAATYARARMHNPLLRTKEPHRRHSPSSTSPATSERPPSPDTC